MAHQAHALPWNTLAAHYKYKYSYNHEPQRKDIFPVDKDTKVIDYFCRALAKRVQEFAETERAKYRPQAELRERAKGWTKSVPRYSSQKAGSGSSSETETRMVYPDEMQVRYFEEGYEGADLPSRVPARHGQDLRPLSKWTEVDDDGGGRHAPGHLRGAHSRRAQGRDYGVAAPRREQARDTLAHVRRHAPRPPPWRLPGRGGGGAGLPVPEPARRDAGAGFRRLRHRPDRGRRGDPGRRNYMGLQSYSWLLSSAAGEYDGDAHNLVHWDYFYPRGEDDWDRSQMKDHLADMEGLKEYLKGLWRLLVVYDLVIREAGGDPGLEEMCKTKLDITFN
ncbi:hypothetical protein PG994_005003 [Apiospora phragmitis]|uniref:Uncharacterized protein n=1 Tax=Apiospora phragmitis TaxID=2905665 RepID=A0ABR1VW18_9PEZI